jgi:hypothetical protein
LRRRTGERDAAPAEEATAGGTVDGVVGAPALGQFAVAQLGDLDGELGVHATMVRA